MGSSRPQSRDMTNTSAPVSTRPALLGWDGAPVATGANLVTVVRTLLAVTLGMAALVGHDARLLIVAYAVYWVGDMLDGWLARRLDEETRLGAIADIVSDRACCAVLICGLCTLQPGLLPALVVFVAQFMVLDCVLSLSFLRWPLVSPNDFHRVSLVVWRLNWSPPAKAINTAGVVLAVATGSLPLALCVALAQVVVKVWSAHQVTTLALPVR